MLITFPKPVLRLILLAAFPLLFSGCWDLDRVVVVKTDGSGTIEEKFLVLREAMKKDANSIVPPPDMSALNIAKSAGDFGEGVTLTAYKKVETKEMTGYVATFEFTDISKLRPEVILSPFGVTNDSGRGKVEGPRQHFEFVKGEVSELTIPMGEKSDLAKASQPAATATPEERRSAREAVAEICKHLHYRIAIRPGNSIVETNARYHSDREITLDEMNLEAMAADPKYAEYFSKAAADDLTKTDSPSDEKYVKEETAATVKVKFK